jgi:DNA-binding MarR family transcriptional regulator
MSYKPPLTDSEVKVLLALQTHFEDPQARRGPSIEEIAEHTEISMTTVQGCVKLLEVRGLITRTPKKWRSIRLVTRVSE